MGKRARGPEEAPEQTNKRTRAQKKSQAPDPVPQRNLRRRNQEKPGRPGPSSHRAPQAELNHIPPFQPPPQQPEQGGKLRQRRRLDAPNVQLQSQQPEQEHEQSARPITKVPEPPALPAPGQVEPNDPGLSDSDASTCFSQDAAAYDVGRGVEAVGTPQAKDVEYWGSIKGAAEFIRSRSGLKRDWIGVRPLGKGGNGIAGLWELRGDDGQVIKQMVVKEETHDRINWREEASIRKVPSEVKIMRKLNKKECHAVPRLFNYKRYAHVYKHRMYMEFCPFKDLSVLCGRYARFRQYLPEPFLWDTFYHLVETAMAMENGIKDGDGDFEIVHRDIKPANIFLGKENPRKGLPFYPIAKLGDFGLAITTNHNDYSNPHDYLGAGTSGYLAPEQKHDDNPYKYHYPLSSYTNVWAIGATMLELLTLYPHADYMADARYHIDSRIKDITTTRDPEYSENLRNLIHKCIEPYPQNRIDLKSLRFHVKAYRNAMRSAYRKLDQTVRTKYQTDNRLYYVRNEINDMPTGDWEPFNPKSPSKPESGKFPDREFPVRFPRFDDDGPEAEVEIELYPDDYYVQPPPEASEERARTDAVPRHSKGHRFSNPVLVASDNISDDGSQDMDLEFGDPPSPPPPPPPPQAPFRRWSPARAPVAVMQAPAPVPAIPQPPAPAPAPAPAPQRIPRVLRNGKIIGYF